jgi:signal transduction histidine kinase
MDRANNSITKKLTWMNMAVSGIALFLACAAFIGYDWVTFRANSARNLVNQAQILGANAASAVIFNDPESAGQTLGVLKNSPTILFAGIFNLDGKLFASYKPAHSRTNPQLSLMQQSQGVSAAFKHGHQIAIAPIVVDGKEVGKVYLESSPQTLYARLRLYVGIAGIVWIAAVLVALLGSGLFSRSVSDPIVHLAEAARMVAREKDYSVRVPVVTQVDEIRILIESFNEMLKQIERQDRELQRGREDLERRVQERTAQLATANKELEAFSYSVSHDLRGPLRSIDGFSRAVLDDYSDKLDDAGKDYLKRVRAAAVRMGELIDDLLKLSRVTRAEVRRESTNLSSMAKSIAKSLQEQSPQRKVEFRIGEGLETEADSRLLQVVLENLMGNAWKYTSRHEQALIEFGRNSENGEPVFYIRDDGAGFDPRYSSQLFGAFQRLHGVKEFPGTGIGLATVQRIIHKHGGEIWAESEVEKGATFYFRV